MAEIQKNSVGTEKKKGGKIIPALCSTLGTIILVALILGALPLAIPRMLGYEIYTVVSESIAAVWRLRTVSWKTMWKKRN